MSDQENVVIESGSGRILSMTDLLGLSEQLSIQKVDLSPAGAEGVVYIRELTESDRVGLNTMSGDIKVRNNTTSFDAGSLDRHTNAKLVAAALWNKQAGELMIETILKDKKNSHRSRRNAYEIFLEWPTRIVTYLAEEIRKHSGIDSESVEERGKDD